MGDDISSGSGHFPTILNGAELHHGKNQKQKRNPSPCYHPLITQLTFDDMETSSNL